MTDHDEFDGLTDQEKAVAALVSIARSMQALATLAGAAMHSPTLMRADLNPLFRTESDTRK